MVCLCPFVVNYKSECGDSRGTGLFQDSIPVLKVLMKTSLRTSGLAAEIRTEDLSTRQIADTHRCLVSVLRYRLRCIWIRCEVYVVSCLDAGAREVTLRVFGRAGCVPYLRIASQSVSEQFGMGVCRSSDLHAA